MRSKVSKNLCIECKNTNNQKGSSKGNSLSRKSQTLFSKFRTFSSTNLKGQLKKLQLRM